MNDYKSLLKYKLMKKFFNTTINKNVIKPSKKRSKKNLYMNISYNTIGFENSTQSNYEKLKKPQNNLINNTLSILSNTYSPIFNNNKNKKTFYPPKTLLNKLKNISINSKNSRIKNLKTYINNNSYIYSKKSNSNSNKLNENKNSFPFKININKFKKKSSNKNSISLNIKIDNKNRSRNTFHNSFDKENLDKKLARYTITNNNSNSTLIKVSEKIDKTAGIFKINEFEKKRNVNKKLFKYISNINDHNKKDFSKNNKKMFFSFTNTNNNSNIKNCAIKDIKYSIKLFNQKFYKLCRINKNGTFFSNPSINYKTNQNSTSHKIKEIYEKKQIKPSFKKILLNKNNLKLKKYLTFHSKNIKVGKNEKSSKIISNNKFNKNEKSKNNINIKNINKTFLNDHIKNIIINYTKKNSKNIYINKTKNSQLKNKISLFNTRPIYQFVKTECNENDESYKKIKTKDNLNTYKKISDGYFGKNSFQIIRDLYNKDEDKIKKQYFEIDQLSKEIYNEKDLDETESPIFTKTETKNNDNSSALSYNEVKDIIIYYDMNDSNVRKKNYLFKKNSEKKFYLNRISNYASRFFGK